MVSEMKGDLHVYLFNQVVYIFLKIISLFGRDNRMEEQNCEECLALYVSVITSSEL